MSGAAIPTRPGSGLLAAARGLVGLLVAAGFGTPLEGQAIGMPVTVPGVATGVTLHLAGALDNAGAGKGQAAQVGVSLGARRVGLTAFVSRRFAADGDPSFESVGAALTTKIFGGPLVPFAVNLQVGAAYAAPPAGPGIPVTARGAASLAPALRRAPALLAGAGYPGGSDVWHVPLALGISWVFPQPVVAVKPWIAPRVDVTRVSVAGQRDTATEFGLSGGLSFGFLNGLSIDVAYDRVFVGSGSPASFGLGLSYRLR